MNFSTTRSLRSLEGTENTEEELGSNTLTGKIIGAAIDIHRALGPGLLESAYEACLIYELRLKKLKIESQKSIPIFYKDVMLDCGYRADLVVEDQVIVEIKSISSLAAIHEAQLLSYLKLSGCKIGLLINFNVKYLKEGIRRMKS
jgi:GxxExxY protein